MITLDEAKAYLRVDFPEDDGLISGLLGTAWGLACDVARLPEEKRREEPGAELRAATLHALAYLYEHREEADHNALTLSLRALLFGIREGGF